MNATKLVELKELLVKATKFSDVYEFFFEHFSNDPELKAGGQKVKDALLEKVVNVGFDQVKKGAKATQLTLFRLPKYFLTHGIASSGQMFGIILFFEDISTGMFTLGSMIGGPSAFIRFRTTTLNGQKTFQFD
jgi:hypothetical protein